MALKIGSTSVSKMYKGSIEVTKGYLGSNLIYSSAPPAGSTPLTNSNFSTARDLWFTNQAQAEATYGLIGNWNTTAVTMLDNAFKVTSVVTNTFNEDISNWDTSNVISMNKVFTNSSSFNQDISSWDTSKVTRIGQMFYNASSFNQPIGSWNVANVTNLWNSFNGANNFNQDLSSWNVNKVSNMDSLLVNTSLDTINYDLILIGWEANLQSQFPNGAGYSKTPSPTFGNTKYTGGGSAATARASLVSNFNWTITDGGVV
jgi:surface protein